MFEQGKLVRDRIPELIRASGERVETRTLDDAEYGDRLRAKLQEEVQEYLASGDPEELADIVEVIAALAEHDEVTWAELERIRFRKRQDRGGFAERVLLIHTGE